MSYKKALLAAIEKTNGKAALAKKLGIRRQNIHQWLTGKRPIPAKRATQIEEATGVSKVLLCPDFPW